MLKLTTDKREASRGPSATAELLVLYGLGACPLRKTYLSHHHHHHSRISNARWRITVVHRVKMYIKYKKDDQCLKAILTR